MREICDEFSFLWARQLDAVMTPGNSRSEMVSVFDLLFKGELDDCYLITWLLGHGSEKTMPSPTAEWTLQQLREAFPFDQIPRYMLRDRDGIFSGDFAKSVEEGIKEVLSAPRSRWQKPGSQL